jgi:hypothetical protein
MVGDRGNHREETLERQTLDEGGPPNGQVVFDSTETDAKAVFLSNVVNPSEQGSALEARETGLNPDPRTPVGPLIVDKHDHLGSSITAKLESEVVRVSGHDFIGERFEELHPQLWPVRHLLVREVRSREDGF